ncbi:unnamed protein product [[Candida] boidinii]|nr:unnamed protein product [[Candida] boidinii]
MKGANRFSINNLLQPGSIGDLCCNIVIFFDSLLYNSRPVEIPCFTTDLESDTESIGDANGTRYKLSKYPISSTSEAILLTNKSIDNCGTFPMETIGRIRVPVNELKVSTGSLFCTGWKDILNF